MKIKTTEQIAKMFNPDFDNQEKWVAVEDIKKAIKQYVPHCDCSDALIKDLLKTIRGRK